MARPRNPDFVAQWKVNLPTTLAARVEMLTFNNMTQRPYYGVRSKLIERLLTHWLARENGATGDSLPPIPTLEELILEKP